MSERAYSFAELRDLARAATPGPWRAGAIEHWNVFCEHGAQLAHERVLLRMNQHFASHVADARFIAAANPKAVLSLLDDLADARARIAELEQELADQTALAKSIASAAPYGPLRTDDASHWILVDQASAALKEEQDRGWRLHVRLDDGEGFLDLTEERVFPERVMRPDANHIRAENGTVRLNHDEARWLRDRLDEIIPELARRWGAS